MRKLIIFLLLSGILISCSITRHQLDTGRIEKSELKEDKLNVVTEILLGSEITVATPLNWNRKILILAHGYRPDDSDLSSAFSVNDPFHKKLLEDGWIIASTSYRRNGLILYDAVEDIEFLRKYLEEKHGNPDEIYLRGSSMGATISTLIAENPSLPYTGVLAIGFPRYHLYEIGDFKHSFNPQIPLLFVSNRDETEAPEDYLEMSENPVLKPAFWTIDRDGHCEVNSSETSTAFDALINYVKSGEIEFRKDGTIAVDPTKSLAQFKDGKAYAEILSVHPVYGNFETGIYVSDLVKLGIEKDTYFRVGFQDRFFRIYYGSTYSDVLQGFWIAFITAEGTLLIARNFADASKSLHCRQGDLIYIESLPEGEQNLKPYIDPGTEAVDLGIESWENLISGNVEQAVLLAEKGLAISPDLLWLEMNLGHAYLFVGEYEKAEKIYKANKGKHVLKESFYFEDLVLEDLEKLERDGIKTEYFDKIKELMQE